MGIDVKLVESTTHTFLLEGRKKETDEAMRSNRIPRLRQISVKKGCIAFTSDNL